MLQTLLPAALLAAPAFTFLGGSQDSTEVAAPATIEMVAQVTPTRFLAVNPSDHPQWVRIGTADGYATTTSVIPPQGVLKGRYPRGFSNDLWIEFGTVGASGVLRSGPLAMSTMQRADVVWIVGSEGTLQGWLETRGRHEWLPPQADLDVRNLGTAGSLGSSPGHGDASGAGFDAPTWESHVPGGNPNDNPDNIPPDPGDDLPPV